MKQSSFARLRALAPVCTIVSTVPTVLKYASLTEVRKATTALAMIRGVKVTASGVSGCLIVTLLLCFELLMQCSVRNAFAIIYGLKSTLP